MPHTLPHPCAYSFESIAPLIRLVLWLTPTLTYTHLHTLTLTLTRTYIHPPITVRLPQAKTKVSQGKRQTLFRSFDPNGNGYLSLAEIDKGVRDVLKSDALFDAKPAIMRAFQVHHSVCE